MTNHPVLPNLSLSPAVNGVRIRRGVSRLATATIAAFGLAVCAFISIKPAAAAESEHAVYCLSSDSENDCSFASLAQCQATASGGLGVCDMRSAWRDPLGAYARYRLRAYDLPRR